MPENHRPSAGPSPALPVAPAAARRPVRRSHHGDIVVDDYEWLRNRDDPEVIAHLTAENAYTEARLAHLEPLREALFEEIRAHTQETDQSVPARIGDWWYYTRTVEGVEYPIHVRVPAAGPHDWQPPRIDPAEPAPGEQLVLDGNAEAAGCDFFALGSFDVSPDGSLLAYAVDTVGDERYTLRIRDLASGSDLPDVVPGTFPGAVFSPDGRDVYYPVPDDAWRPDRILRHRVGTPVTDDAVVFREPDERFWVGVEVSRSQRFVQIEVAAKVTTETWLLDATDPAAGVQVVWPRREGVEYTVEHAGDVLLICHNDGAEDFELVEIPVPGPGVPAVGPGTARVVVPHVRGRRLEGADAFEGFVAVSYRRDALPRVAVARPADTGPWAVREIPTVGELTACQVAPNPDSRQPYLRVREASYVVPETVYDYDVRSGDLVFRKRRPVPGGFDPADYAERREWVRAEDGTSIPLSIVWRPDALGAASTSPDVSAAPPEGAMSPDASAAPAPCPAPFVLYGYGAYETSVDPAFSAARLSLLDRGVGYAVAHVRGGGELGRHWYDQGKQLAKPNTFADFIAVARYLVSARWTTPRSLAIEGASAGGLLIGAVVNRAPELFGGVLARVPFVDALTSMLDPSLPLTVTEWDEWGDPLHDADVYRCMRGYSPYENVPDDASGYPPILATTSLNDTRVLYVEPTKWVARLREARAEALLRIELNAGHGGTSGRYEQWREVAFETAWLLDVLGISDTTA